MSRCQEQEYRRHLILFQKRHKQQLMQLQMSEEGTTGSISAAAAAASSQALRQCPCGGQGTMCCHRRGYGCNQVLEMPASYATVSRKELLLVHLLQQEQLPRRLVLGSLIQLCVSK